MEHFTLIDLDHSFIISLGIKGRKSVDESERFLKTNYIYDRWGAFVANWKIQGFAAELGLQTEQFNQCLASGKYTDKVKAETLEAQNLGLRSTPSVLVNGELVNEGSNYEILSQIIRQILSKSD